MIDQQTLLFPYDIIDEKIEKRPRTTVKDILRELTSIHIEIDIALDEVIEGDTTRAKRTLQGISERIEKALTTY